MAAPAAARSALLVIAHPDDEAMFFAPTLQQLVATGHSVSVLCLSTGNAEGLGHVRAKELVASCQSLQIPATNVHVVNHPKLQDGMKQVWPDNVTQQQLQKHLQAHPASLVITFDCYGVSGHVNHVAVQRGVRLLLESQGRQLGVDAAWQLVTLPLFLMLLGPLLLLLWMLMQQLGCWCVCSSPAGMLQTLRAMSAHKSQWVWYRRLFVLFSSYAYLNFLRPMQVN